MIVAVDNMMTDDRTVAASLDYEIQIMSVHVKTEMLFFLTLIGYYYGIHLVQLEQKHLQFLKSI
jgi:hypothetical protein